MGFTEDGASAEGCRKTQRSGAPMWSPVEHLYVHPTPTLDQIVYILCRALKNTLSFKYSGEEPDNLGGAERNVLSNAGVWVGGSGRTRGKQTWPGSLCQLVDI